MITPKTDKTFLNALLIAALAVLVALSAGTDAAAQKKPDAFQQANLLAPNNREHYKKIAQDYEAHLSGDRKDLDAAASDRNRLVFVAVEQIDLNFYDFQKSTRKKRALLKTVLDILEIGAHTAISITNGERAKSLIAEGLGFVQLSRSAFDKNFSIKETQILFNKMVAKRSEILGNILTNTVKSVEQYPFELAMVDVIAYYKAGTFDGAMENLNIDTGAEANEAKKDLEDIKIATRAELDASIVFRATLADLFTKLKSPDAAIQDAARKKLKAGLKAVPELLDGLTPDAVDHLSDPDLDKVYRQVRQKLVRDRDKVATLTEALNK